MDKKVNCAKCNRLACVNGASDKGPKNCPTVIKTDIIKLALSEYEHPEIGRIARNASIQEAEGYMHLESGLTPINTRVEEVVQFSRKMGYKKLGVAFCMGLRREAKVLTTILEKRGFQVVSICCKHGGTPKERIGIDKSQQIEEDKEWESMCNPISQAMILNKEGVDFNILVGLCVGHDSLFLKYSEAMVTVLIAKDRVFGHNPAAGLYLAESYYKKLMREDSPQ